MHEDWECGVFEMDGDAVEGLSDGDMEGTEGERMCLPKEDEVIKKMVDPRLPSQEEVDKHYVMGHMVYRNWCPVCVRAQGKEMDHSRDKGKERKLPEYSWDYCFPGDELGFKWTVLVGKERASKAWMAEAVPTKGIGSGRFVVDRCLDFIEENGDKDRDVILKTDQEPAITVLIKDLVEARQQGKTMVEESPVKSSGRSGRSSWVCKKGWVED